jgi:hypothetical protein
LKITYYNRLIILFALGWLFAQEEVSTAPAFSDYQISSENFFTDANGNIKMFVNVWGHVNGPGLHEVYDGIDLATLMSIVGGPKPGANLKTVRLYREVPEENGDLVYTINLDSFFQSGDRSEFIKVKPNDTIVIPQKLSNYLWVQVGTLNTFLSMMSLYLQIQRSN